MDFFTSGMLGMVAGFGQIMRDENRPEGIEEFENGLKRLVQSLSPQQAAACMPERYRPVIRTLVEGAGGSIFMARLTGAPYAVLGLDNWPYRQYLVQALRFVMVATERHRFEASFHVLAACELSETLTMPAIKAAEEGPYEQGEARAQVCGAFVRAVEQACRELGVAALYVGRPDQWQREGMRRPLEGVELRDVAKLSEDMRREYGRHWPEHVGSDGFVCY